MTAGMRWGRVPGTFGRSVTKATSHAGRSATSPNAQYTWGSRADPRARRFVPTRVASTPARARTRDEITINNASSHRNGPAPARTVR